MREITSDMLAFVKGGMKLDDLRGSGNVIDQRGVDKGIYIDANGSCWAPGTSSSIMYPNGGGPSYSWGNSSTFDINSGN